MKNLNTALITASLIASIGIVYADSSAPALEKSAGGSPTSFLVEGEKVVGNVYYPKNYKEGDRLKAIVVVGPKGAVKEQVPGIYAKKLADKGFITFAIDHRTYGESEGLPRHFENPSMKVDDVKTALNHITTLKGVDKDKVGLLGVCNGGGFGASAAIYDKSVKAYASVAGIFDMRDQIVSQENGINKLNNIMKISGDARQKYLQTGEVDYVAQMPEADENSNQLRKEAAEYYLTERGRVPNWGENKMATMSMEERRSFNITDQLQYMSAPYLAIAGTEALTLGYTKTAYERAQGDKELFEIEGATHVDLYDVDEFVDQAVTKLNSFYNDKIQ
ncbi:MAG: alpha/beta hydrolase [Gammaproteobacteria bacterium]|nr:alpha/beta hydrolase [Gammaproteobacteria bacterium]